MDFNECIYHDTFSFNNITQSEIEMLDICIKNQKKKTYDLNDNKINYNPGNNTSYNNIYEMTDNTNNRTNLYFLDSIINMNYDKNPLLAHNIMATAIQENGMKPLTNKSLNHVKDVNNLDNANSCTGEKDNRLFDGQLQSYVAHTEERNEETHEQSHEEPHEEPPELDIVINNVVCSFSVRCHLNLREIALKGSNVEYRRENGMITMKLRRPYTTASIWSSGKVTCTGATSEVQAKIAARRFARSLQKLGFKVRFNNYRVVNVLGTCCMPFAIKITSFSIHHKENADYEPELHPGVTYKLKDPKATLKIFSTGSVTVTAPNVAAVQAAIEHIYPLVYEFRKERTTEDEFALKKRKSGLKRKRDEFLEDEPDISYESMISDAENALDEVESDGSWD